MKHIFIVRKHLFGNKYLAINLFGFIFTLRELDAEELNHELIHSAQQRELLYLPFFLWYGIEWLVLFLKYKDSTQAYFHIRFEQEAYRHQGNLQYLQHRKLFGFWRCKQ